ncbi:GNAT family N-acetyltransferase [Aquabacterium sp.]|uniref:GNAT family N-acetyltransferase n=1 Tax=Aquabacterium sp. TaxID=1872578 RepID=UPI003784A7AE
MTSYTLITGYEQMDLPAVHAFLATTYWSPNVPFEVVDRAARHSLCFGLRDGAGQQVAYARVVSDRATFAYLADVYVLEAHRGRGLSTQLLDAVFAHPDLQGLRRFMLATRDAHALYARYGFTPLANPPRMMERHRPDVYATAAPAPAGR